jgi:hypothetical protein
MSVTVHNEIPARRIIKGPALMNLENIEQLFSSNPFTTLKTGLRFTHFIGLALGLGGATLLDLMMLRFFLTKRIQVETFDIFDFSSKIVNIGLFILWVSGFGFLLFYALFDTAKIYNPKVHAKLMIVAILSINGIFIHSFILPTIRAQVGKVLFDGFSPMKRSIFITSGAISAVSWYVPVALGVFSQLNNTVPATALLATYLFLIVMAASAMNLGLYFMGSGKSKVDIQLQD